MVLSRTLKHLYPLDPLPTATWTSVTPRSNLDICHPLVKLGHLSPLGQTWTSVTHRSNVDICHPSVKLGHLSPIGQTWTSVTPPSNLDICHPSVRCAYMVYCYNMVLGSINLSFLLFWVTKKVLLATLFEIFN